MNEPSTRFVDPTGTAYDYLPPRMGIHRTCEGCGAVRLGRVADAARQISCPACSSPMAPMRPTKSALAKAWARENPARVRSLAWYTAAALVLPAWYVITTILALAPLAVVVGWLAAPFVALSLGLVGSQAAEAEVQVGTLTSVRDFGVSPGAHHDGHMAHVHGGTHSEDAGAAEEDADEEGLFDSVISFIGSMFE